MNGNKNETADNVWACKFYAECAVNAAKVVLVRKASYSDETAAASCTAIQNDGNL